MARRISIDPQLCEGHGLCVELAPDVFQLGREIADTTLNDGTDWELVDSAAAACPRHAISIVEE